MSSPAARSWRVIGLMSGTSLDGIDAALVETDGEGRIAPGKALTVPYDSALRERLRATLGGRGAVVEVGREVTLAHAAAVERLLGEAGLNASAIDLIGFHGHTILHEPEEGRTWQVGDPGLLASLTGIDVVADFRSADMAEGGEGAPLVPVFHAALTNGMPGPVAVLNIGGVANVTWIGPGGPTDVLAFDTGPGNALIDDWMLKRTGSARDDDGAAARAGRVDETALAKLMDQAYFERLPPKSLDRDAFDPSPVAGLSTEDGAATLTAFTAAAVAAAARHFPAPVTRWIVAGGGRHNATLVRAIARSTNAPVSPAEEVGWDGDALEAQAFGYLAVRSLRGLPLSLPRTTGVRRPMPGGVLYRRPAR